MVRGWLGVNVQKVTPDLAKAFNLKEESGALVGDVISGSPAEKAGIKAGDIIIEFNGKAIKEMSELPRQVAAIPVGKTVDVKVLRKGEPVVVKAQIQELQDKNLEAGPGPAKEGLGLSVKEFTPELARRYSLNYEPGVIVLQVKEGGPADEAGIQPGDLIKEINRKPVKDLKSYENLMAAQKKGAPLLLRIKRGDSNLFVSIRDVPSSIQSLDIEAGGASLSPPFFTLKVRFAQNFKSIVSSKGFRLKAPAKVNLRLKVLGKRADGFHEIETVMQRIGLWDILRVEPAPKGLEIHCPGYPDLEGEQNLIWRAVRLLEEESRPTAYLFGFI